MGKVSGKVAIISGGAGGIGEAAARALIAEGAQVVISDMRDNEGAMLARELGDNARYERHDVRIEADWIRVVKAAETAFGPVSILVNSAGVAGVSPLENYEEAEFRRIIDINQVGTFLGMKSVVPSMRRAGGGAIINVSSTAGLRGSPNTLAYVASKFAVRGMTKVAALDLAPYAIRVNSVHPGPTRTPMIVGDSISSSMAGVVAGIVAGLPVGRLGEPSEIASMILLLAGDDMQFATGAEFVVDGGETCH